MSDRKEEILAFLKSQGQSSLQEVADHLGLTKQGALRHLEALGSRGLIEVEAEERHGRGRPEHIYRLTPAALDHFPGAHRELAADMVHFMPPAQLKRFFEQRAERLEAEYAARLTGLSFSERVRELARLATEHGHMAEVQEEADGSLTLRQCHCPIGDVAAEVGHPCQSEIDMYGRLLGVTLKRATFMPDSDPTCSYQIPSTPHLASPLPTPPSLLGGVGRGEGLHKDSN